MKNSSVLFMLLIATILLFISCVQEDSGDKPLVQTKLEISLSDLLGHYTIDDFSDFGIWALTVERSEIDKRLNNALEYLVEINQKTYPLKKHKINKTLLIAFPDESVNAEDIKGGTIKSCSAMNPRNQRTENPLHVEKVIFRGVETKNGTNTYEISLEDYIQLKEDNSSVIFSNGTLIRPLFVKSNEENAYALKTYYDARQVAPDKTTDGAFVFFKERDNHKELLFFGNANRVDVAESGVVTIRTPDERDRLRQLGEEGDLDGTNAFSITTDDANGRYLVKIDRNVIVQKPKYAQTHCYEIALKSATDCELNPTAPPNIHQTSVLYADGASTELIRNSRFTGELKLTLYSSTGEKRASYNHMSEAVNAAQTGDTIKTNKAFTFNESTQSYVNGKELTITSDFGPFTLDYTGSATRAFFLDGTASLTIKNAIVQNANITGQGAAFLVYGDSQSLSVQSSVIGTNTATLSGGAFALFSGQTIIEDSTLTNNSNTQNGGAIYNNATCTLINSLISENHANLKGGAIYNLSTLHFYLNTIVSNTTNTGNSGLLVHENSVVYNSGGEVWRQFNAPQTTVNLIEKRVKAENTYTNQGTQEGDCIRVNKTLETPVGTLSITPSTATEFERKILEIEYETGGFFAQGSVTIDTPDGFPITPDSSVTIGTRDATNAAAYTYNARSITINHIHAETGTRIKLTLLVDIPTGYVNPMQTRDISYSFDGLADADGSGEAWSRSQKSTVHFISHNKSINTDFRLKAGYDYLKCLTTPATKIQFEAQTAEQTTVASVTNAIEATDGYNQIYQINGPSGLLDPSDILPAEATLTVTAEHGNYSQYHLYKENGNFKLIRPTGRYNLYKTLTEAVGAAHTGEKHTIECSATTLIKEPEIVINTAKEIIIKPSASASITFDGNESNRVFKISGNASITFKSTIIQYGATHSDGGGIHLTGATLNLENCRVEHNDSRANGGGIYLGGGSDLTLSSTLIRYNESGNGGGIYMTSQTQTTTLRFDKGSVYQNDASGKGGGIYRVSGYILTSDNNWSIEDRPGEYNTRFSVNSSGQYLENNLSGPAKVYENWAGTHLGEQMYNH